ncbi:DUF7079 family protein [Xanthomonas fragariae]|uniref:DUF7079 family protein n=1 Tax=Xanthomonas fragariae TaxID=48664 RepID=UPI003D2F8A62
MTTPTPAQRRVREALLPLYLDSGCDNQHDSIMQILAASPFPLAQLRTMVSYAVHPLLIGDLRSMASVWDGFDPEGMAAAIAARHARRWRWPDR